MELKATELAVHDGIGLITLNRPHRMNAWTGRMHTEYRWCLATLDRDPSVGAIVVTGKGRGFCVGGDAEALAGHVKKGGYDAGTPPSLEKPGYGVDPLFEASFAYQFGLSKPILAAMNGPAAGVGLALACFADLRFAAAGARFTTAHGKLNLPAEYGLSWLLPRLIGLTRANELLLSSRIFLTDEAFDLGLLNALLEPEELMPYTYDYARRLTDTGSPGSLRETKRQIYTDLHRDVGAAVRDADALLERMMTEADYREAVSAFMEKRGVVSLFHDGLERVLE